MTEREVKEKREEFLSAHIVKNFNSLLVRIHTYAGYTYIISGVNVDDYDKTKQNQIFNISDGAVMKTVYDQNVQNQINEIVKNRDEYIKIRYGSNCAKL